MFIVTGCYVTKFFEDVEIFLSYTSLSLTFPHSHVLSEFDNVMNIEPAILVMHHSVRTNLSVTATLLDFLCRIMNNFSIPHAEAVKQGENIERIGRGNYVWTSASSGAGFAGV